MDQLLVFFALLLMHLLLFQGLSAKYRTGTCRACMLLELGQACFKHFCTQAQPCKQSPKSQGGSLKCTFNGPINNHPAGPDGSRKFRLGKQ